MKALLTALVVGVTLLAGCAESSATPAPMVEDCSVNGDKICDANPLERTEAWGVFRVDTVPEETVRQAFSFAYRGVANEGIDFPPSRYVTLKSQLTPGKVHVFEIKES